MQARASNVALARKEKNGTHGVSGIAQIYLSRKPRIRGPVQIVSPESDMRADDYLPVNTPHSVTPGDYQWAMPFKLTLRYSGLLSKIPPVAAVTEPRTTRELSFVSNSRFTAPHLSS